jgi:hypothetical protein
MGDFIRCNLGIMGRETGRKRGKMRKIKGKLRKDNGNCCKKVKYICKWEKYRNSCGDSLRIGSVLLREKFHFRGRGIWSSDKEDPCNRVRRRQKRSIHINPAKARHVVALYIGENSISKQNLPTKKHLPLFDPVGLWPLRHRR